MTPLPNALRGRDYWTVAVASMEQIIGAALSTIAGIIIPMLKLAGHSHLSPLLQGLIGASGLAGISLGSLFVGRWADAQGYRRWFRLCPLMIVAGAAIVYWLPSVGWLIVGLTVIGFGVGGGYSLDGAYISELLPKRWALFMVGIAKATSSIGFIAAAALSYWILSDHPEASDWPVLIWLLGGAGLLTFFMRIKWVQIKPNTKTPWDDMFRGANLEKVIFCGIPWACEGLGVYGIGVFLPVLIMALGLEDPSLEGMARVVNSVKITTWINFFILPGFILGLCAVRREAHVKMLCNGFVVCALGLLLLLVAYLLRWPVWVSLLGFMVFEVFLNAGPHLVTFILPNQVYPAGDRAAGSGIASMLGKVGAIIGVLVMPLLLSAGGMVLVLSVSAAVMVLGAVIGHIYGIKLGLMKVKTKKSIVESEKSV